MIANVKPADSRPARQHHCYCCPERPPGMRFRLMFDNCNLIRTTVDLPERACMLMHVKHRTAVPDNAISPTALTSAVEQAAFLPEPPRESMAFLRNGSNGSNDNKSHGSPKLFLLVGIRLRYLVMHAYVCRAPNAAASRRTSFGIHGLLSVSLLLLIVCSSCLGLFVYIDGFLSCTTVPQFWEKTTVYLYPASSSPYPRNPELRPARPTRGLVYCHYCTAESPRDCLYSRGVSGCLDNLAQITPIDFRYCD